MGGAFAQVVAVEPGEPGPIAGSNLAFSSIPPLVNVEGGDDEPNVLIILDNSNSMDEQPGGEAVGSANPASKSEIARNAIKTVLSDITGEARVGLMAYRQNTPVARQVHNSYFYTSYDPATWNPDFTPTIPVTHPVTWTEHRFRTPNVDDPGNWMYFNIALPYYASNNQGSAHCYSTNYNFAEPVPGRQTQNYQCWNTKTGTSNANTGYSNFAFSAGFVPTDSDIALGFNYFGQHLTWKHVGPTWFNNGSPGRGFLHANIADLTDATHMALLQAKLATSQFAVATDTPIRNAGLTPIEGTLLSALDYFQGTALPDNERGVTQEAVPENICLQKDAVVLVTDGLPSRDANGSAYPDFVTGIQAVEAAAAQLAALGVKTYVIGFALPTGLDPTILDAIAAAGDTLLAFDARDADTLDTSLDIIFSDILARPSSATAAAVVANSSTGTGAVYQALYEPQRQDNLGNEVNWIGTVHSLWIDDFGLLREDNPGGTPDAMLGNYGVDPVIEFFFDEQANTTRFRRISSSSDDDFEPASSSVHELEDLSTVWDARTQLAALSNLTTQRGYSSSADSGRYMMTWVDEDRDGLVDSDERKHLVYDGGDSTTINDGNLRYLNTADPTEAASIINYVRGEEINGLRSRTIDYDEDGFTEVLRMGDVVHSTPTVVGAPAEAFDLLYGDASYADFRIAWANRRSVTLVGANDGALHAFNAGFFTGDAFATSTQGGETAHPLGSELWAVVPGNLLPHLRWLADEGYEHTYYVDGKPRVFDAKVFAADSTHVGGWGTIAVLPYRLGGGDLTLDVTGSGDDYTFRSAFMVLDITDPESPPTILAEIPVTIGALGTYSTSEPTVVAIRDPEDGTPNEWFLLLGSGPTNLNTAYSDIDEVWEIHVHDLKDIVTGTASKENEVTGIIYTNTFVGSMATSDWDLDFKSEAVYFGHVRKPLNPGDPADGLFLKIDVGESADPGTWTLEVLHSTDRPMVARPSLGAGTFDDVWVFGGSGRFFVNPDKTTVGGQRVYGVKDTEESGGDSLPADNLIDMTGVAVFTDGSVSGGPAGAAAAAGDTDFDKIVNFVDDPDNDIEGWFVDLPADGTDPAWRVVNSQALFGGVLLTPAFQPSADECVAEGSSIVIGQFFKTGTGAPAPQIFGIVEGTEVDGVAEVETVLDLGRGLGASPSIHAGRGTGPDRATACTQTSTGAILCDGVTTLVPILSGELSWREFTD